MSESNIISLAWHRHVRAHQPTKDEKIAIALAAYGTKSLARTVTCERCNCEQRKSTRAFICNFCQHKNER